MKLSELNTGEKGVIVKVLGHGGFRKRIIEMGFTKGKTVEALLNAPLQDPVKYKVMGYEVSLRHDEANLIEIFSEKEAAENLSSDDGSDGRVISEQVPVTEQRLKEGASVKRRTINVALVGNPNCGKTSLFNFASGAHARVGNYSGVTVDAAVAKAKFEGYTFNLTDLPGTYSLSCYSPEEMYVRQHLFEHKPDIVINVIDSSNIERNLYLTTQLTELGIPVVTCTCEGFRSKIWTTGFDAAYHTVLRGIVKPAEKKTNKVNIINFWGSHVFDDIVRRFGYEPQYIIPFSTVEELSHVSEAAASIHICPSLSTYMGAGLDQLHGVPVQLQRPPQTGLVLVQDAEAFPDGRGAQHGPEMVGEFPQRLFVFRLQLLKGDPVHQGFDPVCLLVGVGSAHGKADQSIHRDVK